MHKIIRNGSTFHPTELDAVESSLPKGVYTIMFSEMKGYYLQKNQDEFSLPSKIYNRPDALIARWMKTWADTKKNMGILLSGIKGSGKTITAQLLCNTLNAPVICVTTPFVDEGFKQFMAHPCLQGSVVFIDEFEKIYDQNTEAASGNSITRLLTFMDGSYETHLLFVCTSNSDRISEFLMNRPGRIRYAEKYTYLTPAEAIEIVEDRLHNKEHAQSVYTLLDSYGNCTFDIVVAIIDDMNRFKEDALAVAKYMNLKRESTDYAITLEIENTQLVIPAGKLYSRIFEDEIYDTVYLELEHRTLLKELLIKELPEEFKEAAQTQLSLNGTFSLQGEKDDDYIQDGSKFIFNSYCILHQHVFTGEGRERKNHLVQLNANIVLTPISAFSSYANSRYVF